MKLLKADHETLYEVSGVPGRVRKPVNLDGAALGFTRLRSLRLYQFKAGSVIDGHAEEDEVFVIVTAGSVEMKIGFSDDAVDGFGTFTLSAPGAISTHPFAAYLPPHSVYRMTPHTDADISYARATPTAARRPAVLDPNTSSPGDAVRTLVHDHTFGERLRLKVLRVSPTNADTTLQIVDPADHSCETLVHLQGTPATKVGSLLGGSTEPLHLESWDTVALSRGEGLMLRVEQESTVTVLAVSAC